MTVRWKAALPAVLLSGLLLTGCSGQAIDADTADGFQADVRLIAETVADGDRGGAMALARRLGTDVERAREDGAVTEDRATVIGMNIDALIASLESGSEPEAEPGSGSEDAPEVTSTPSDAPAVPAPEVPAPSTPAPVPVVPPSIPAPVPQEGDDDVLPEMEDGIEEGEGDLGQEPAEDAVVPNPAGVGNPAGGGGQGAGNGTQDGSAPGNSGNAPGHGGGAPGNSGNAPGNGNSGDNGNGRGGGR